MKDCKYCGKVFNRGFNLRRHEIEYCPLRTENHSDTMSSARGKSHASKSTVYDGDYSPDMDEEEDYMHADNDDASAASDENETDQDSQSDESEYESELDADDMKVKSDPWMPLKEEAKQRHSQEYEELVQNFIGQGNDENASKVKAYIDILPKLQKELRTVYLERLLWIRQLRRDPIHKKVMHTRDEFIDNDGFDPEEALEAAVNKRKIILKKLIQDEDFSEEDEDLEDASN